MKNVIYNGEGLKIEGDLLYINGSPISLKPSNLPGVDSSKVIISIPDFKSEWKRYTIQEIYHRKQARQLRRAERKRQRAERRAQKKYRFLWFRF